ncbi:hypothetical protein LH464_04450 [Neorhizobium sp. T786]|nr:hypothetical protein [Neorhizobium xiangyangii]
MIFPGFLPHNQAYELDLSELRRWREMAAARAPKKGGK